MLPDACTTIGKDAFEGCNLKATVYAGSPAEAYMQANNIPYDVVNDPFHISIMEDYTCSVESYWGSLVDIVVPERFGPYTVTRLGNHLFDPEYKNLENCQTLVLPDTISEIGFYALGYNSFRLPLIFRAGSTTYYTLGPTEDAFKFLESTTTDYDLVILDPPAFAKHKHALHNALKGYTRLNKIAISKIKKGGIIFTFSCSQAVNKDQFRLAVFSAAAQSGRRVRIIHQLHQPADHPINIYHPEGEYLKGLVIQVE
jgi:hypothetical protein